MLSLGGLLLEAWSVPLDDVPPRPAAAGRQRGAFTRRDPLNDCR
jgi:hypothetical protein